MTSRRDEDETPPLGLLRYARLRSLEPRQETAEGGNFNSVSKKRKSRFYSTHSHTYRRAGIGMVANSASACYEEEAYPLASLSRAILSCSTNKGPKVEKANYRQCLMDGFYHIGNPQIVYSCGTCHFSVV